MYLIKRVDFNLLENQIGNAIIISNVGVIDGDESVAQKWIDEHDNFPVTYVGWDRKRYPYYEKEPVEKISYTESNTNISEYRVYVDVKDANKRILDCMESDEIDRYFNSTTFSDDTRYKQAMMHGMCIAGMLLSDCDQIVVPIK